MKAPRLSKEELLKLKKEGKIDFDESSLLEGKRKSKYGNKKVVYDDIEFDSQREGNRYLQLRMLLRAGEIKDLQLQVEYELNEGGTHSLKYIADFEYTEVKTGQRIIEDVKGWRTKEYRKKRKLMKQVYGIDIKET